MVLESSINMVLITPKEWALFGLNILGLSFHPTHSFDMPVVEAFDLLEPQPQQYHTGEHALRLGFIIICTLLCLLGFVLGTILPLMLLAATFPTSFACNCNKRFTFLLLPLFILVEYYFSL